MVRPCFLVVDREFSGSISSRKLVIETAKFNVITAYSSKEAVETLVAFPAVHGAVVDEHMNGSCSDLVSKLKQINPSLPVIAVGTSGHCGPADYYVEPFSPEKLLALLRTLQPQEAELIQKMNQALSKTESKRE